MVWDLGFRVWGSGSLDILQSSRLSQSPGKGTPQNATGVSSAMHYLCYNMEMEGPLRHHHLPAVTTGG